MNSKFDNIKAYRLKQMQYVDLYMSKSILDSLYNELVLILGKKLYLFSIGRLINNNID